MEFVTGKLISKEDWGQPHREPESSRQQNLRSILGLIALSKLPMAIFWGEEHLCLFNDAFQGIFIDKCTEKQRVETWRIINPLVEQVWIGHAVVETEAKVLSARLYLSPIIDDSGLCSGVLLTSIGSSGNTAIFNELQESRESEQQLKESVERYEDLIRSSPFAIGILRSEKLNITTANQAIIDIWGKGWEIMGRSYFEALPELAEQGYREVFGAVYKTGIPFNAVETPVNILQHGKMQLKYYNFLLYAQRNRQGEIDGIGIIATEVTSQALFNKQIQESEKRFRLLADSMPQLVWTTDPHGRFNYFNHSLADYSGLIPDQLDWSGWQQMVHPDDSRTTIAAWLHSMQAGGDFLLEHRLRHHTGEYRWHLSRAIPQKDETGGIQMWVGTSTDIQEQKIFTSELERQVNERTKELEKNNIELARINRELQSFAYISSHDLQEPLRKIQTFATRLAEKERDNLSDSGKLYFDRMNEAALRMQMLIDDLLAYSRTSAADRKFERCDLNKVIEEVKADFHDELQQKNAIVETAGLCEAYIIPIQFRQLVQNLVSNAIKFSSRERPLEIKIAAEIADAETFHFEKLSAGVDYCRIRFADNGIGFEQRFSDKIFEVFQRLHGRHEYSGTGIGLAIVKRITENHGGIITATGELDKGATFDIYIPAYHAYHRSPSTKDTI